MWKTASLAFHCGAKTDTSRGLNSSPLRVLSATRAMCSLCDITVGWLAQLWVGVQWYGIFFSLTSQLAAGKCNFTVRRSKQDKQNQQSLVSVVPLSSSQTVCEHPSSM